MSDTDKNNPSSSKKKVLIVEDDVFIGNIILKELLKVYQNATLITSGTEAAETLKKDIPDILILDIFLPGINGLDLLESLRKEERTKELKVLVVSNTDQSQDRERAKRLGAAFLLKATTTPIEIAKEIQKILAE